MEIIIASDIKIGDKIRPMFYDKYNEGFVEVISVEREKDQIVIKHKTEDGRVAPFWLAYRTAPETRFQKNV
jgi:hypothetical protein